MTMRRMARELSFSPAAERNKAPILQRLQQLLPDTARVLEIAAGTGQHAEHFAAAQPGWTWLPTDGGAASLPDIAARCAHLPNVLAPLRLDVMQPWPALPGPMDAVYCANMLHISPWATCTALMQGAAAHLKADGCLVLYGPYLVEGEPTAPSNLAFDGDLKARDASWGLRWLSDVVNAAAAAGLAFEQRFAMPANHLLLAFRLR